MSKTKLAAKHLAAQQLKDAEQRQDREDKEAAIRAEAADIAVDQFFINEVLAVKNVLGVAKAEALRDSFDALLDRQGIGGIKSNYWRVLVIVKKRVD